MNSKNTLVSASYANKKANTDYHFKKLVISRLIAENVLVFFLQYTGMMLSAFNGAPFSLAAGSACAFAFLRGYTILPAVWLGSCLAYFLTIPHFVSAFGYATVLTVQTVGFLWMNHRLTSPIPLFYCRNTAFRFILISLIWTLLTYFVLTNLNMASGINLFLSNLNGLLILPCALITLDTYILDAHRLKQLNKFMLSLFCTLLLSLIVSLFFSDTLFVSSLISALIVMLIFAMSIHYGRSGFLFGLFMFAFLLDFFVYLGNDHHLLFFSCILCFTALAGLLISAKNDA